MNLFKKYFAYAKDNPEGLWFKKKLYGWGWVPVTWQGWMVILIYLAILVPLFIFIDTNQNSASDTLRNFLPRWIILTLILIGICYKKGEKPKWQWGPEPEEHYICLGGCRGVSKKPGVCQAPNCANHNHQLVRCYCTDGLHNNFQPGGANLKKI